MVYSFNLKSEGTENLSEVMIQEYLADPGEARGYSTNTVVIKSVDKWCFILFL